MASRDVGQVDHVPSSKQRLGQLYWRNEHLIPISLMVVSTLAINDALGYPRMSASFLPLFASVGVMVLSGIQLVTSITRRERQQGQIMDLGMRSEGTEGVTRSGLIVVGLFTVYFLVAAVFGLKYSGIVFAFLLPLALGTGARRWLTAIATGTVVVVFTYLVGDLLFHTLWPAPFLFP